MFTYDALNRVKTYTDPLGIAETYNYDLAGNLTSKIDRKGQTTSYAYDALNRLRTITFNDGSSIVITWDAGNRPRQFADSINGVVTRDYDGLDRLTREVSPQGQVDYEYDDAGRRTRLIVAGRTPVEYAYDDADRLTRISQGAIGIDFTYDASNRRATITLPNGISGIYSFDDADQLLSIVYASAGTLVGDITYGYDLSGRRISQSGSLSRMHMPGTVTGAAYDSANRLMLWGGNALTYDNNGNLTADGAATYSWNARDELLSTSEGAGGFAYDALGRRTSRTVAGDSMSYLHDGLSPVLVNNDQMIGGLGLDDNYARVSSGGATSFLSDGLGSTRSLRDGSGASTAAYSYSPFGETVSTGSDDTPFQFTGRENDGATGLYYYRARYYSARIGRFIQSDPIGLEGGINTYAYALNDPLTFTDPLGLAPGDIFDTREAAEADRAIFGALLQERAFAFDVILSRLVGADQWEGGMLSDVYPVTSVDEFSCSNAFTYEWIQFLGGVAPVPGRGFITGYTRHGLNQAISRDGRGVSARSILDAVRSPTSVRASSGGTTVYRGADGTTVVLNRNGRVVTTYGRPRGP